MDSALGQLHMFLTSDGASMAAVVAEGWPMAKECCSPIATKD